MNKTVILAVIVSSLLLAACGNKGPLIKPSQVPPPADSVPAGSAPAEAAPTDAVPADDASTQPAQPAMLPAASSGTDDSGG